MRKTAYPLALCGLLSGLAIVVMLLGGVVPAAVYCCPILAMVILLPVREEFGTRAALTTYAAVSLLALLLTADKELAFVYVFLGWYSAAQPGFYRLRPAALRISAILLVCSICLVSMYAMLLKVFCLGSVTAEFNGYSTAFRIILLALGNVVFLMADLVLLRMSRLWNAKLRRRLMGK